MLGEVIEDPEGMEQQGSIKGMGLLPMKTTFIPEKTRTRVKGHFQNVKGLLHELSQVEIEGYEIHMGVSESSGERMLVLTDEVTHGERKEDGLCYVHGIFDRAEAAEAVVRALLLQKGCPADHVKAVNMSEYKEEQYNKLADIIRENVDMQAIRRILEEGAH